METFEDNSNSFMMDDEVFAIMGVASQIRRLGGKAFLAQLKDLYPKEYTQLLLSVGALAATPKSEVGKLLKGKGD